MNNNLVEIVFLIDASGSMQPLRQETISNFNRFIEKQRLEPTKANVTIYTFNYLLFKIIEQKDIQLLNLSEDWYIPGGQTALLQASCQAIDAVGKRLADLPEALRPGKVIFVTITDGQENYSSSFYTGELLAEKIKHQQDVYKWGFLYLGANQDSYTVANKYGYKVETISNYQPTRAGTTNLFVSLGETISTFRTTLSNKGNADISISPDIKTKLENK